MLRIVKVSPTVGKSFNCAVWVTDYNCQREHEHGLLNSYFTKEFGDYASIEYVQSFAIPDVDISEYKVQRFVNMDVMIQQGGL